MSFFVYMILFHTCYNIALNAKNFKKKGVELCWKLQIYVMEKY